MRVKLVLVAGLLAAAMPVSAQYVTHPKPSSGVMGGMSDAKPAVLPAPPPDAAAACPIVMRAERRSGLAVMQARGGGSQQGAGQRIYLEIERGKHAAVEATVTVHGTRAQARVFPAQASPALSTPAVKGRSEAVQSFTLRPGSRDAERFAYNLLLEGFTSVQSVSLDAVTYADGSSWKAASGHACSVEPDPLMLISAR